MAKTKAMRKTPRKQPSRSAATPASTKAVKSLPRVWKGKRARFHADPATDQLFGIVTALTAELSVAYERLSTLEAVLRRRGHLGATDLEDYQIDDAEALTRTMAREELIERVFQVLEPWRTTR